MATTFEARALALGGRPPLQVQRRAAEVLQRRGRAVAVLPTGAGKTLLAALPFAAGLLQPKQMVFATPLRTLTDAQTRTLRAQIDVDSATDYLGLPWSVMPQTGSAPENPLFTAPAVVCTFDQALSSALSIAYSVSRRRRGINAGAVLGAYLVADEIHLYPRNEALTTLLWLLRQRPELPFLLMTATLSRAVADKVATLLDAELIEGLPAEDAARLGVAERERMVSWQEEPFDAVTIAAEALSCPDGRVLVVVNTVARAQALGRELAERLGWERVMVLHSRFYPSDRARIEDRLRREMGKGAATRSLPTVLVATQVVEAGLDISAGLLFSEWAPANTLVQRWGRCARWGGQGRVVVAPPPGLGANVLPLPYARDEALAPTLEPTRGWLREHANLGVTMTDEAERTLLDHAHDDADRAWVDQIGWRLNERATAIGEAVQGGLYSHAGGLIRRVDQRTVLIHGEPEMIAEPWQAAGFSLGTGTIRSLLRGRDAAVLDEADDEDGDLVSFDLPAPTWRLKVPIWDEVGGERRAGQPSRWHSVEPSDLTTGNLFALHPSLASYDENIGLELSGSIPVPPAWWARPVAPAARLSFGLYRRETLREHVERMERVFGGHPALWPTVGAIAEVVERWCAWPPGLLRRLATAAILLHDAGKLSDRWQQAIKEYQEEGGNPYVDWLVHSDERPGATLRAGPHALAGAALSTGIGGVFDQEVAAWREETGSDRWDDETLPSRVLFTAIKTHHGDQATVALGKDELVSGAAREYLSNLLREAGLPVRLPTLHAGEPLHRYLVISEAINLVGQDAEYLAFALVSRLLRLADGWSQDETVVGSASLRPW